MTFSLDLAKFGQKVVDNAEKFTRKTVFDMYKLIVRRMPVRDGRAKANTQISINSLPENSIMEFDKSGQATISKAGTVIANFKLGDTIFIYNNVEYIYQLEYLHTSKQAPHGMFRISFEETIQYLEGQTS